MDNSESSLKDKTTAFISISNGIENVPEEFYDDDNEFNKLTRVVFFNGIYSPATSKYKLVPIVATDANLAAFIKNWESYVKSADGDHDSKIAKAAFIFSKYFDITGVS